MAQRTQENSDDRRLLGEQALFNSKPFPGIREHKNTCRDLLITFKFRLAPNI